MESLEPNKLYSNELDYDGESISKFKFDSSIFSNLIVTFKYKLLFKSNLKMFFFCKVLGQLDSKFIVAYSTIDGRSIYLYFI